MILRMWTNNLGDCWSSMQSRTSSKGLVLTAVIACTLALVLAHVPSFAFADDQPTTEPVVETEAIESTDPATEEVAPADPESEAPAVVEEEAIEGQAVNDLQPEATEEEEKTPEIPALRPRLATFCNLRQQTNPCGYRWFRLSMFHAAA